MSDELHPPPRCLCVCHQGSITDRFRADGVSLYDVVEAAVACEECRGRHAVALLSTRLANAPAPRIVEPVAWVDPDPPKKPDGTPDDGN